jgi:hypothetical protein
MADRKDPTLGIMAGLLIMVLLTLCLSLCACCAAAGHHDLEARSDMLRRQMANQELLIYNQSCIIEELIKQNRALQDVYPKPYQVWELR